MEVHTVTAEATGFTCNAYLVTGAETTLIDVGAYEGVVGAIRDHVDAVDRIVLTHQHGDHVAQLDAVLDAFDPELACYGAHPRRDRALADSDELSVGDETFEVVYTPGHAADHVSLVSASTIFSGDVVVYNDGAFDDGSFGRTDKPGQSRDREIESIETLAARAPDSVEHLYAGHGDPFTGDVRAVLARALERAKRREPKYPDE